MKRFKLIAALGLTAALAGCGGVTDSLGFGRNPPDEFAVVDRPPLALPPDFDLRPPKPGAPRPQDVNTKQRANTMLFGAKANGAETSSENNETLYDSEKVLLKSAGAENASPDIRETVDREASQKVVGTRHLVNDLLWWHEPTSDAPTVDAPAEAERIKKTKEEDAPVNKGATPIIERNKSGWLEF